MKKSVSIWNLPYNAVYVDLNRKFKTKLLKLLFRIDNRKTVLEKMLDEREHSLDSFLKFMKPLAFIKKVVNLLEKNGYKISLEIIEKNIIKMRTHHSSKAKISTIYNPKLPINFLSEDGARLVMALLCDGWIGKSMRIGYGNNDKELKKLVYNSAKAVFGEIYTKIGEKEFKLPKICALFFVYGMNFPIGEKVKTNPHIPQFLLDIDDEFILKVSLRQAFDDEGTVIFDKNKHHRAIVIKFSIDVTNLSEKTRRKILQTNDINYAPNLIRDIRNMLSKIGIECNIKALKREFRTKKSEIRNKWILIISGRKNLEKYSKKIGFSIERKRRKLERMVQSYEREQCRYGDSLKEALRAINLIEGEITSKSLAKVMNRTSGYCKELLNELEKKKYIKLEQPVRGFPKKPAIYEMIK